MTSTTLGHMLTAIGITANEPTSNPTLHVVNLQSDGNFYYDYFTHRIHFDLTDHLLRIKYYNAVLVSSIFNNFTKISNSTYSAEPNIFGSYSSKVIKVLNPFREPKIGDIIYTIDSSNEISEVSKITSISGKVITSADDLDTDGLRLCYASGISLDISGSSIEAIKAGEYLESFLGNDGILILRRPLTENTVDEYVSGENIEGFSLRRFGSLENFLNK